MDEARQLSLWGPTSNESICHRLSGTRASGTDHRGAEFWGRPIPPALCNPTHFERKPFISWPPPLPGLTMGPPCGIHHLLFRCGLHPLFLSEGSLNNLTSEPGGLSQGFHPDTLSMTKHHGKPCDDNAQRQPRPSEQPSQTRLWEADQV